MKRNQTIIAILIAVLVISGAAMATAQWQKLFGDTYKPKSGTVIAAAKCQLCHAGIPSLNPYGMSLKGKKMAAASLKAVGKLDSDKDKFSNIAEIKAGTLPGNPKSKPACKPKK